MNKKIIVALMLCFPVTTITAQQKYKGFHIGLEGNAGINKFIRTDIRIIEEMVPKTKSLFGADLDIGYHFNKHIALYTGIGIQHTNFSLKLKPVSDFRYREWIQVHGYTVNWEIPLRFRYNMIWSNVVGLYCDIGAKGGLVQSYLVNFYIDDTYMKNEPILIKDRFGIEKWSFSPLAGIGVNFSLGAGIEFNLGAEFAYQVNNLFSGWVFLPPEIHVYMGHSGPEHWEAYPLSGMIKAGFHVKL